jgi:signal transduction histidine kinase
LPHIFKRFYRGERSRSQIDGSGLGLAIARRIADTHQAELIAKKSGAGGHYVSNIDSGLATHQPIPTDNERKFRSG